MNNIRGMQGGYSQNTPPPVKFFWKYSPLSGEAGPPIYAHRFLLNLPC